jgi:N-acetylglucosamine-6-phosphate deacetylase
VTIGDDLVARAPDGTHLVGSAATMAHVEALMRRELRLADDDLQRLMAGNPRRVLGV